MGQIVPRGRPEPLWGRLDGNQTRRHRTGGRRLVERSRWAWKEGRRSEHRGHRALNMRPSPQKMGAPCHERRPPLARMRSPRDESRPPLVPSGPSRGESRAPLGQSGPPLGERPPPNENGDHRACGGAVIRSKRRASEHGWRRRWHHRTARGRRIRIVIDIAGRRSGRAELLHIGV